MDIDSILDEIRGLRARVSDINDEYADRELSEDARNEWNTINEEIDGKQALVTELRARSARLEELSGDNGEHERQAPVTRARSARGSDIWDLSTIRMDAFGGAGRDLRDRSMRALEIASFEHDEIDADKARSHVEKLVDGDDSGRVSRLILSTGSPTYRSAFRKTLAGQPLNGEEIRAMSLTGASGGFAVPYTLDPTVIPTSNGSVNPIRAISRKVQITGDEWRGVSAGAITASYDAEATEVSDDSPTLAQPTISTEKAQAFIPYSIEIGMDWSGFGGEMAKLLAEAKDDLEADKFLVGSGTNEPFGVITGATTTVTAGGTAAFAVADLYSLENALGARFRARASVIANRAQYNRVRQFDTAGGATLWMYLRDGTVGPNGVLSASLLGYPAYEAAAMSAVLTTGAKIMVLGDFGYYVIVDRIGMTIETIPHLFGAAGRPTGQRGIYAYWRNSAKVVSANAFRVLVTG